MWSEVGVQIYPFACEHPAILAPFVESALDSLSFENNFLEKVFCTLHIQTPSFPVGDGLLTEM